MSSVEEAHQLAQEVEGKRQDMVVLKVRGTSKSGLIRTKVFKLQKYSECHGGRSESTEIWSVLPLKKEGGHHGLHRLFL